MKYYTSILLRHVSLFTLVRADHAAHVCRDDCGLIEKIAADDLNCLKCSKINDTGADIGSGAVCSLLHQS
jgi:hypothetical protein